MVNVRFRVFPRFGIGDPMLIVPRFYHVHRSGAKIVAASGHLYKNLFAPGSVPDPAMRAYTALP